MNIAGLRATVSGRRSSAATPKAPAVMIMIILMISIMIVVIVKIALQ